MIVSFLNIDESLLKLCNSRLYSLSFIFNPMTPRKQGQAKKNENLAIQPAVRKKEKKLNQQNYTQTIDAWKKVTKTVCSHYAQVELSKGYFLDNSSPWIWIITIEVTVVIR